MGGGERAWSLGPDRRLALFQCNYGACVWERRAQERSYGDRRERERHRERARKRGWGEKLIPSVV